MRWARARAKLVRGLPLQRYAHVLSPFRDFVSVSLGFSTQGEFRANAGRPLGDACVARTEEDVYPRNASAGETRPACHTATVTERIEPITATAAVNVTWLQGTE